MKPTLRLAAFAVCLLASTRADLDLDSNGLGDVWEAKYRPAIVLPGDDPDGDGRTNAEECEAGTDPFRSDDVFAVDEIALQDGNLTLSWTSQAGKRYQLQTTETPGDPSSWQSLPGIHAGTGTTNGATVAKPDSALAFFRVVAADTDADGDGLTDWEELQAGFDPNANVVHPCHCGDDCGCGPDCGCGGDDLERLTAKLQAVPRISVEVVDAEATEPTGGPASDTAGFIVRRSGVDPAIADAELVVYPGGGHNLHWEEPERFASDLLTFVNQLGRRARTE